ncbi:MAG TPA: hypothetical protein PLH23_15260, partial [Hyphomonadaceae bacterium]|nr:hypothetical protein [Hyphomonadaceae bacterium]HPI49631.1 hypothetical protein [Hyphomonadaceae bacterium]
MSGLHVRAKHIRRAGILAIILAALAAPLAASAWQGQEWTTGLRWSDGREVQWRATRALGCDGSNVELRLLNNSTASGDVNLKDITFQCTRPSTFVAPSRTIGAIAPGGTYSTPVINCACAEKGGVKELMSVAIDIVRGENSETYANGCSYKGGYASGERDGRGVYACPDGYRYEGNYTTGEINGTGKEKLATGEVYEGAFVNGERHGLGRMTYIDGSTYEGDYVRGKREGAGTQTFKDGSVYVGEWKGDRRNGEGVYTTGDKVWTYDGAWLNDRRSGQGKLSSNDGSYTYIGAFADDRRTGQATATFGDGRVFRGMFANDQQAGPGELTFKDGRKITGQFLDHRPNGAAVEVGSVATIDGTWVEGALQGRAVVQYATGERFEGQYVNGKRNGVGTDTRLDGSKEEC